MTADEKMKIMMKQIQDEIKAHAAWKESQSGLRDQFAMAALIGVLANEKTRLAIKQDLLDVIYDIADGMLEARKEKK